jgi:hypothetical protein
MKSHGGITSTGKLQILPPELPGNSTRSHLAKKHREHGAGNVEFCLRSISFMLAEFLTRRKI